MMKEAFLKVVLSIRDLCKEFFVELFSLLRS